MNAVRKPFAKAKEIYDNMLKTKKIISFLTTFAFLFSLMLIKVPQGSCITIQEERELSKEFMNVINARYRLIKDPVIVDYLNRVGHRILDAMPPQPFAYQFYVIQEDVYNAFATPAGHIFINSGLFGALESEEELAGIIGHEIAHVVCRHISQGIERSKKIGMATLAGMVAGVLLGVGGAGEAAGAVTMSSVAAGQSVALAYSRENEMQADQLGLKFLTQAGYSGWGLLTSLKKIRSKQWYGSEQVPTYLMTHPASEERMSYIDNLLSQKELQTAEKKPLVGGFELARTRVVALYTDAQIALDQYHDSLAKTPGDPMANYGYALALTRKDRWHEAAEHMQKAIEGNAMATHMLKDLGKSISMKGNTPRPWTPCPPAVPTTIRKFSFIWVAPTLNWTKSPRPKKSLKNWYGTIRITRKRIIIWAKAAVACRICSARTTIWGAIIAEKKICQTPSFISNGP